MGMTPLLLALALHSQDPADLEKLVRALDADAVEERTAATEKLVAIGEAVEPLLNKALEGRPGQELQLRIRGILERILRQNPERTLDAYASENKIDSAAATSPDSNRMLPSVPRSVMMSGNS